MQQNMLEQSYSPLRTSWYVQQWNLSSFFSAKHLLFGATTTPLNSHIDLAEHIYWTLMQDISLGVALGSATQIEMFVVRIYNPWNGRVLVQTKAFFPHIWKFISRCLNLISQVPLCVLVAWAMGIKMDLDFSLLETGSLALAIIVTAFTLQVKS